MRDVMMGNVKIYIYDEIEEIEEIATNGDGDPDLATLSDASFGIPATEAVPMENEDKTGGGDTGLSLFLGILCAVLFVVCLVLAYIIMRMRKGQSAQTFSAEVVEKPSGNTVHVPENMEEAKPVNAESRTGKLHNIGRRSGQQDSLGMTGFDGGTLAIVADGMGGLSDGDRVSQKIVMTMLQDSAMLKPDRTENCLYEMIAHANREVNQMLGTANQYKSGSTVIAALIEPDGFQWATVGDSHIYLYRGKQLLLLNREHVYEAELMQKAVNGRISFQSVKTDKSRSGLTSFIGMGELKYIDGSMKKLSYLPGDWLLLMSDGVFNTISEPEICRIVQEASCASEAAERMEQAVLAKQNPKQDNFTAILLEL